MRMPSLAAGLILAGALSACATSQPEYRMIPTGDHGVGVRFSRGNAAMVSNGPAGAVMLLPIRYNASNKLYFAVAAFNTSSQPINFGTEDVRIRLDDGAPVRVQDFNFLRQEAKRSAQREMAAAWVSAGIEGYLAYRAHENHPRRTEIAYRRASGEFYLSSALIEQRLIQTIAERGRAVLQTTTIDPGATFGGFVFADQLIVPEGTIRQIVVEVNFAGAPHQFTIALAPSGTEAPVPMGIPAVPARTVQAMQRTPQTWHYTDGPPPTPYDGLEIVE